MAVTVFAARVRWNVRALGFNPLVRASDRLEALAVLGVLVVALFTVPVAARAEAQVYEAGVRTADEQAHSRHSIEAVAVDGSATLPADFEGSYYVRAQWREGTRLRTEQVVDPATIRAGDPLTIWLDDTGTVVAAPLTPQDAKLSALGAAGTVWVAIVACTALLAFLIRKRLDRTREHGWDRELRLLAHNDDGWANRHT
ncbi:Rv1733c family protein [Mycolicibacterium hodleri]|uniref:Transmembrane protein n=1 Tax=Mycolicibacterium hodleri TaxID=49897 RepID=A0A502EDA8_9MYCO|nr:hypothetical protein [Mycolicibacterium hodleri]TPG34952.1 hypothetical protein EAH80_09055 [Mycolicibacterium hodleri]